MLASWRVNIVLRVKNGIRTCYLHNYDCMFFVTHCAIFADDLICLIDLLFGYWLNIVDFWLKLLALVSFVVVIVIDAVESFARFFRLPPHTSSFFLRVCKYVCLRKGEKVCMCLRLPVPNSCSFLSILLYFIT